jgi:hypothetical protein
VNCINFEVFKISKFQGVTEGNRQMDMDNDDDEHETENNIAEVTDGHKTNDSTALGSGHRSRRRSHTIMPPVVLDSEDGKTVVRPTGDG